MSQLPDAPDGWRAMEAQDGRPRFDSEDRTLTVICTEVSTSSGSAYNCRLFESDAAYQMGNPTTSTIATSWENITDAVRELDNQL